MATSRRWAMAGDGLWASLRRCRSTAFLLGGLILTADTVLVTAEMVTGAETWLILGQVFVGVGWTAALLGLLGVYPDLADRSYWTARAGALFVVIGVVTFAAMAVTVLAYYAGIPPGTYEDVSLLPLPGVIIGSILGFVTFSVASLRAGVHSRRFGLLLLVPAVLVLTNILRFIAGFESTTITLVIVILDALAMLTIGYALRGGTATTDRPGRSPDTAA